MGLRVPTSMDQVLYVFSRLIELYPFHFFAGNTAVLIGLLRSKAWPQLLPLTLITFFFECFAFMTSAKIGSAVNYYTPFILFSSVLILVILSSIWKLKLSSPPLKNGILFAVMFISGMFIFRQAYHYTAPFLKFETSKSSYKHRWIEIEKVRSEIKLKRNDRILVADPLVRNMMATNTVMPNLDYYAVSPFDYSESNRKEKKELDYIIFKPSNNPTIDYHMKFFNVTPNQYIWKETKTEYTILAKK